MSQSQRKKHQLVQVNWFNRSMDRILAETDDDPAEKLNAVSAGLEIPSLENFGLRLSLSNFTGKGIGLYFCTDEGIFGEDDEEVPSFSLKINRDGVPHFFTIQHVVAEFPLVEGDFTPGIYRPADQLSHCEIKEPLDLARLFAVHLSLDSTLEDYKLVFHGNKVDAVGIADGEVIESVKIYPSGYFDVHCPFCQKLVVTNGVESAASPFYKTMETPCAHFVGLAHKIYDRYEPESLADKGINYKIDEKTLYFETGAGWQRATEHVPPGDSEHTFYASSDKSNQEVFLFLEAGR